jgi:anti-sigma factor RsiW
VRHPAHDLTALVDGALAPARAAEVEAHAAACAECRARLARLRATASLLAALPPPPAPGPFFAARLEARLAEARARPRGLRGRLARLRWAVALPASALAAAAVVALVGVRAHRAEERAIAAQLDLLQDLEAVASAGDVETPEDAQVVAHLDALEPAREGRP